MEQAQQGEISGIMATVKLGPVMNEKTFDLIRDYNNGWSARNLNHTILEQQQIVKQFKAAHGSVFVEVLPTHESDVPDAERLFYAVQVFPVCRDASLRARLLHTLDQLVKEQNPTHVLYNVYYV